MSSNDPPPPRPEPRGNLFTFMPLPWLFWLCMAPGLAPAGRVVLSALSASPVPGEAIPRTMILSALALLGWPALMVLVYMPALLLTGASADRWSADGGEVRQDHRSDHSLQLAAVVILTALSIVLAPSAVRALASKPECPAAPAPSPAFQEDAVR